MGNVNHSRQKSERRLTQLCICINFHNQLITFKLLYTQAIKIIIALYPLEINVKAFTIHERQTRRDKNI